MALCYNPLPSQWLWFLILLWTLIFNYYFILLSVSKTSEVLMYVLLWLTLFLKLRASGPRLNSGGVSLSNGLCKHKWTAGLCRLSSSRENTDNAVPLTFIYLAILGGKIKWRKDSITLGPRWSSEQLKLYIIIWINEFFWSKGATGLLHSQRRPTLKK